VAASDVPLEVAVPVALIANALLLGTIPTGNPALWAGG
jgi:hypothetical protein